jgi:2-polyprenyl-3-methyl-5-hydroxy-6-metoxy-1,4-benzoquinol methylase
MSQQYVCPASLSGSLDNFLRRLVHKPEKILSPYINNGMVVFDIGCGPGYFTAEMARLAGESGKVIAADLQQAMLDKMMGKISGYGLEKRVNPHLCQSEGTGIREKADFILTFWMVHEVPDQVRFFEELKSLLNPGGKLLVSEPKMHVSKSSFYTMISRLETAGLQIIELPHIALSRSLVLISK